MISAMISTCDMGHYDICLCPAAPACAPVSSAAVVAGAGPVVAVLLGAGCCVE